MKGIEKAAVKANGASRLCDKCKFNRGMFSGRICEACDRAFITGYKKGATWALKQTKNESEVSE